MAASSISPAVPFPDRRAKSLWLKRNMAWLLVALFSLLYFGETLLRAAEKPLWFDELCTLYICRLPTFGDSWAAVLHGADFNPPLFYVIHRLARALFGEGQIAMRLPEIFGFWMLSVCLFRFVSKRVGWAAGWIAMVLPMLTGAYFYAYEARPHGLVLGFLGLAMVCWQEMKATPKVLRWRVAFGTALACAYLLHCYAVLLVIPFALTETWRTIRNKEIRVKEWFTLATPAAIAVISFVPLLQSYRNTLRGTGFGKSMFAPTFSELLKFYGFILTPCLLVVLVVLAINALRGIAGTRRVTAAADTSGNAFAREELVLTIGLALLPVFGIVLAVAVRGPFFARYFLGGMAGCALLLAYASVPMHRDRKVLGVAALTGILAVQQFGTTASLVRKKVPEWMVEPSSGFAFSTIPGQPLASYSMLSARKPSDRPIIITGLVDFLYLVHYAPWLKPQLYSVSATETALPFRLYRSLREWCHIDFNREETYDEFLADHTAFTLYGTFDDLSFFSDLIGRRGGTIHSLRVDKNGHFLAEVTIADRK